MFLFCYFSSGRPWGKAQVQNIVHGNAISLISITGNENKNNGMLYACHAPSSTVFSSLLHLLSVHGFILVSSVRK